MELSLLDKQIIWLEFKAFEADMYLGKSKEDRDALQQFFTPADLTIQMLEALDETKDEFLKSDVLDPTSGSGNLLSAAAILGVPGNQLFGNEYAADMVVACRKRIKNIPDLILEAINDTDICNFIINLFDAKIDINAVKERLVIIKTNLELFNDKIQIHRGNALQKRCLTDFSTTYNQNYRVKFIDDLQYAQGNGNGWKHENEEAEKRASVLEVQVEQKNAFNLTDYINKD